MLGVLFCKCFAPASGALPSCSLVFSYERRNARSRCMFLIAAGCRSSSSFKAPLFTRVAAKRFLMRAVSLYHCYCVESSLPFIFAVELDFSRIIPSMGRYCRARSLRGDPLSSMRTSCVFRKDGTVASLNHGHRLR
jgi:hypothetical protein